MAWWRYRRRPWRRWRRRRGWGVWRKRPRRTFRRRRGRRYVSRWRRRRYRRRRRRGRRRRGRRRRHRQTIIMRQWQPDVIKTCFITGWMPLIICGNGHTQFNFITHEDDIPPERSSYGGNFTNITFSLAALFEQYMLHRNRWSRSNHDLELARYIRTTLKLYRHETVDYIVTYSRTGPFETNEMSYMLSHPLMMLLNKHHVVVPSLKTKPRGKKSIKITIKPPKLMINKWYFAKDICQLGLFQLYATGANLQNPWLRSGTNSPCITFHVLKNSIYDGGLTNLADTEHNKLRESVFKKLYPTDDSTKSVWQLTYNKNMQKIYYAAAKDESNSSFKTKPYNWENYKTNYKAVNTKWNNLAQSNYAIIVKEYQEVYKTTATFPPPWDQRQYLSHDYGIFSPYFLTPQNYTPDWHTAYTKVRYNPLADKGIGNRIWVQWCSEKNSAYDSTKSKCMLQDLPLYVMFYGYFDYVIKCTGVKSAWTDMRVSMRSPYTEPKLTGSTSDIGFIPIGINFMNGDMPTITPYIPIKWWFKWYPMITHQKSVAEAIVSCGPFMPREQEAASWDITVGYKATFKWGGSPLPPQPIDDPCQKPTHEIPDPDKYPPRIQISDPQTLGPATLFHSWDIRRGLINTRAIKRVSEYADANDYFSTGVGYKRPRLETQYKGHTSDQEEDAYHLLRQLQKEQETSSSEEEQAPQKETSEKEELLKQLQLQRHNQRLLTKGIKHLLGDVLRLRTGVHWHPSL
nr:MAG: ORF1 [Torque teno virus]